MIGQEERRRPEEHLYDLADEAALVGEMILVALQQFVVGARLPDLGT